MSSVTEELDERDKAKLRKACLNMVAIDDKIRVSRENIRALQETKRRRETNLLNLFQKLGIEDNMPCEVTGESGQVVASLKPAISQRKEAIKIENIHSILMETLNDAALVEEICVKIVNNRAVKKVPYVKRTKGTGGKKNG